MTHPTVKLPKDIFRAHYFFLRAQHFDQLEQSKKAMGFYLKAARLFTDTFKKYPKFAYFPLWSEQTRLSIARLKQLNKDLESIPDSQPSSLTNTGPRTKEEHTLQALVTQSIVTPNPKLSWADIIGLDAVVEELQKLIFLPLQRTELLEGNITTPRTGLLFGPPGCGKTHLVRILAAMVNVPVYSISAATLLSKWMGESQKMVHAYYKAAWANSPSIVFIDEFDGLFGSPSYGSSGSEASTTAIQIQKELQQHMDGLYTPLVNQTVTIAATNFPWHLQLSQIRRFDRVLYLPPPNQESIAQLLHHLLTGIVHQLSPDQIHWLSHELRGYTPNEIVTVCEAARQRPYEEIRQADRSYHPDLPVRPLALEDFKSSLSILTPILLQKGQEGVGTLAFRKWNAEFGLPAIDYPIQSWEKRFHVPTDDPNPVSLEDV